MSRKRHSSNDPLAIDRSGPIRMENGRIFSARKRDADAVIAEAQRQFSQLDIAAIPDERQQLIVGNAKVFAAGVRTRRTKQKGRRRIDKNGHVRTERGHVRVVVADVRGVEDRISSFIDLLLRSLPESLREKYETEFLNLELKPESPASLVTRALVCLSDILRAIVEPWDHDVFRQFGIVALPDGYPATLPVLRSNELLGRLPDELEFLPIRTAPYEVEDPAGDRHSLIGPASKPDGSVGATIFRAWKAIGIAKLNKLRESLPPPSRRRIGSRFGPEWPYPTRLAGGRPGRDGIDIRVYLQAEHFGVVSDSEDDLEDPEDLEFPEPPAGES